MREHTRAEHEEDYCFITGLLANRRIDPRAATDSTSLAAGEAKLPLWLIGGGASGHAGVYRAKGGWCATLGVPLAQDSGEQPLQQHRKHKQRRISLGTCFATPEEAAKARCVAEAQITAGTFSHPSLEPTTNKSSVVGVNSATEASTDSADQVLSSAH